ncbi:MAG: hypothetical protein AB2687_08230 [Candidatus Thiodiazotropha taylori]
MNDFCWSYICFTQLNTNTPAFFGFSEYLTSLALMVLAWTIADIRYRFRIQTTSLPLLKITFIVLSTVGLLTLLTDLWSSQQWYVPKGNILTPALWQAFLGSLTLITFLSWAWIALIRKPRFNKYTCEQYGKTIYKYILNSSSREMAVAASELQYAARSIIRHAEEKQISHQSTISHVTTNNLIVNAYASDMLLLIADKRFCKTLVEKAPITIYLLFDEITLSKKYHLPIDTFSKNIVLSAIENKDSFLYHETDIYSSGLLGHHKPVSLSMFSSFRLANNINSLLELNHEESSKWDNEQIQAYCRVICITLNDYVLNHYTADSTLFNRINKDITDLISFNLCKINGNSHYSLEDQLIKKLNVIIDYFVQVTSILNTKPIPNYVKLRIENQITEYTIFDSIAESFFEIISAAACVQSPAKLAWYIQRNLVWRTIFMSPYIDGKVGGIILFKLRRLIYNEVNLLVDFPNYKGAELLALCLNVMGINENRATINGEIRPLYKAIRTWTIKNFDKLYRHNTAIADACLVDTMHYKKSTKTIVKEYSMNSFHQTPEYDQLIVD